jgi:hypothetical protein
MEKQREKAAKRLLRKTAPKEGDVDESAVDDTAVAPQEESDTQPDSGSVGAV